jgi:transcriptional regulator with XRE-family HTH domain
MEDQETLEAIGKLIAAARKDKYPSRRQLALAAGIDVKTIMSAEGGKKVPHPNSQRRIEQALGWRKGSIEDLWERRADIGPDAVTLAEMERGADAHLLPMETDTPHVSPASRLTDEELLAELSIRFWGYKVQAAQR